QLSLSMYLVSTPSRFYPLSLHDALPILGSSPTKNVAVDMSRIDNARAVFRPTRSPTFPQTIPPKGRAINETANTANVARSPVVDSVSGKNATAIMVARYP